MSQRLLYLDQAPGETRGVVLLDGEPEHLLIQREGEDLRLRLGARLVARVASVEPAISTAFLDLGSDAEAILPFAPDVRHKIGEILAVEIRTEPRRGKLAVVRALGPEEGSPRLLEPPRSVADRLRALDRHAEIIEGRQARVAADDAEAQALSVIFPLPGGGDVAIETTRALTAVDIDLGARKGAEPKRVTRQANLAALHHIARLLRLKGLGGLIVIDLVGRGHDGAALMTAARAAFGPDNPGVAIGPVTRFGTMELTVPRRARPVGEILCDASGRASARTVAGRLLRRLQDEAQAQPGARLVARCSPDVAREVGAFLPLLAQRFGERFTVRADLTVPRDHLDVGAE